MRKLLMACLWAVVFLSVLAAGCDQKTVAPTTSSTAPATIPAGPRIVSTVPAATLNLVLMGAADKLVGVSKYDRLYLPEAQQNLTVVGDYETMDFEQLVKLHPTALVIQTAESRISPRLREVATANRVELINIRLESIDDIWTTARILGRVAEKSAAAETAITLAQQDLKEITDAYAGKPRPRVLYVMTPGGASMMVAGDKTIYGEMIELAGGKNIGADVGRGYPIIGKEGLIKLAPEVLLIGAPDEPAQQVDDPRLENWRDMPIPAARSRRIYLVTDGNSQMPSIDVGKNVRVLAEMIHANEPAAPPAKDDGVGAATREGGGP